MAQHSEYREEFDLEHPHSYDHSEPKYSLIAILGGLTVVLLILVAIGIQGYYQRTEETIVHQTVLSRDNIQLQELRNREQWELTHYAIEDKEKGTVRIPIEQAMRLAVEQAKSGQLPYPTNPYPVKTEEQIGNLVPPVSPAGAAAVGERQNEGVTSSPNAFEQPKQASPQH
jgi:hypothetical protein